MKQEPVFFFGSVLIPVLNTDCIITRLFLQANTNTRHDNDFIQMIKHLITSSKYLVPKHILGH